MKKITRPFTPLVFGLALVLLSGAARAALIDNGTFVTDPSTSTDYLKLTETDGLSYEFVVTNDSLGLIAGGWGLTSQLALVTLNATDPSAFTLITDGYSSSQTFGAFLVTDKSEDIGQPALPGTILLDGWSSTSYIIYNVGQRLAGTTPTDYAVSLSRPSIVPVPAAVWLFGSGLMGLVGVARRKKV